MLVVVEVLALAAAFFLPWSIAEIIKARREGDGKRVTRFIVLLAVCAVVIGLTILLAFKLMRGQ